MDFRSIQLLNILKQAIAVETSLHLGIWNGFYVGWAIFRCLSPTPHPIDGQGGSILLVHYSMIILKPAIFGI